MQSPRRFAILLLFAHSLFLFALVPLARRLEALLEHLFFSSVAGQALAALLVFLSLGSTLFVFWKFSRRVNDSRTALILYLCGLLAIALLLASFCVVYAEIAHLPLYALLAIFAWLSLGDITLLKRLSYSLCVVSGIGFVDELLQGLHPQRFFDLRDLALNSGGGLLGLLLILPSYYRIWPLPQTRFFTFLRQSRPAEPDSH